MIYAQIKDSVVVNTIVLDDTSLISLFSTGYDYFIEITLDPGSPGVGWGYDGTDFTPPAAERTLFVQVPSGDGIIPSAASTLTVTDDRVLSTSTVVITITTNDTTAILQGVTPVNGSFTINMTTPGLVDLEFQYVIIN